MVCYWPEMMRKITWKWQSPISRQEYPFFIDKPLALSVPEANEILSFQQYEGQLFSCSSLRYAEEFLPSDEMAKSIGTLKFIEGIVPKFWNTYAVHIIEPRPKFCKESRPYRGSNSL